MRVEQGELIADKYRIERLLARGGMSAVYVARHLALDADVALKLMDPSMIHGDGMRDRFATEARAAAKLTSPYLARVHDYGVHEDVPFLVMELLQGEHLGVRLSRDKRLSKEAVIGLNKQIARGLRVVHEAGIVHRDIKPQNLFLARYDDEEIVKILDFGIAKSNEQAGRTRTGSIMGSLHYLSPEQARDAKRVDHRTDLWALGVVLYRALTGQMPFMGKDVIDLLQKICLAETPSASAIAPDLGPSIDVFFVRAFERDPNKRFQSAREMADELAAALR